MAHPEGTVHASSCRCARGHGRMARRYPTGTNERASLVRGYRRNHQRRLKAYNTVSAAYTQARKIRILTAGERHASDTVGEDHLDTDGHVLPSTHVVASPHSAEALRTSVEGASQDEGTLGWVRTSDEPLGSHVGLQTGQSSSCIEASRK